jgi:hypothetical protein
MDVKDLSCGRPTACTVRGSIALDSSISPNRELHPDKAGFPGPAEAVEPSPQPPTHPAYRVFENSALALKPFSLKVIMLHHLREEASD